MNTVLRVGVLLNILRLRPTPYRTAIDWRAPWTIS